MQTSCELVARALVAALLVCAAGETLDLPDGPSSRLQQGGTLPPSPAAALHALPWALAIGIGAASCLWLLQRYRTWRRGKRQRHKTLGSGRAAAPSTAALSKPPSSAVLRRSADGTILSPFHKQSSLPPFSSNSPIGSPTAPYSAGAIAAEAAKRVAALLLPAAGGSLRIPWLRLSRCENEQPLPSQEGLRPPQPQLEAAAALSPSTPGGSNEPLQEPSVDSLHVRRSSWAAPPPELARHLATLQQTPPPPAAGSSQQQHEQHGISASSLPPRLRELFVEPSAVKIVPGLRGRLGEGASGYVIKARFQEDIVAAKVFDLSKSRELRESFLTECSRLARLRHPNIITLLGMSMTRSGKGILLMELAEEGGWVLLSDQDILLMELAEGRDLFSALQLSRSGANPGRVFGWWRQGARVAVEIARGLNYCHHKGYVHGDIKSSNVLLSANGTAKLADIAFSRHIVQPELESFDSFGFEPPPLAGTFAWMAPEVLLGTPATPASDIYSFGVVLHEIITGEQPMRGSLRMPHVPEECPQEVCDLMMRCLSVDPQSRPTAGDLLSDLQRLKRRNSMDAATAEWGAAVAAAAVAAELPSTLRRHASVGSPTCAKLQAACPSNEQCEGTSAQLPAASDV